ncbi:MAG TPA: type I secretion C-terminal target domain-containing protein [Hyphomicrobiaceae bacterium]|nr:type I secretion C-terminal target domain-containing protein [Hyphomicrobiaceae bacterium]
MTIIIEAVATGTNLIRATTGPIATSVYVDPVADGPSVTASPDPAFEGAAFDLNIALAERDIDGSETLDGFAYVRLNNGAALVGVFPLVAIDDADATIDGQSLVGFYRVPAPSLATLQALGAPGWHGSVNIEIAAVARDNSSPADPTPDADNTQLSLITVATAIAAVANAPIIPASIPTVSGNEDAAGGIPLSGLSAALDDVVTTNGGEQLSVVISGAPLGTRFSSGTNNGDGSWTIPVSALATLRIIPPLDYSGRMSLSLNAVALELSNGDEATSSVAFFVDVTPVADSVEILTPNVVVPAAGLAAVPMNVRMQDDSGLSALETAPELLRVTFTGVPTGAFFVASHGGTLTEPTTGTWIFTGTEAQANALQVASGPNVAAGTSTVLISAVTIDGASTLATPVLDSFELTFAAPSNPGTSVAGTGSGETLSGGAGNDVITGLGGGDTLSGLGGIDRLQGGTGADNLSGGSGRDLFIWSTGDTVGGADTISDFTNGVDGDAIDVSALLVGFNAQTAVLSEYLRLKPGDATTIQVDADGDIGGANFVDLATLTGATGLDVDAMRQNGNLIV